MELNMKYVLIAAAVAGIALSSAARADMMAACNDESMMKAEKDLMAMTDPAKKDMMEMGMKELDMAKLAMKESKEKDCSMHLDAAMKASMGQ
jgi:ATP-dependent Zn protease